MIRFSCPYARVVSASALCAASFGCDVPRPEDAFWPSEGGAERSSAGSVANGTAQDPAASFVAQADASVALPSGFGGTGATAGSQGAGGTPASPTGSAGNAGDAGAVSTPTSAVVDSAVQAVAG
ncbi:MAG: hypothetical protein RL385_4642, partial [Pseudomonadota bacterium]